VRFLPWLLYEIVVANVHLVYLVCRPQRLRPQVVRFRTELRGDVARVFLGNAITLTPGTITLDIVGDEFIVHAVSDQSAASLQSGEMERRIGQALNPSAEAPRDGSRG
jgi:multicomponent Na+:H+ antiporter subunit E